MGQYSLNFIDDSLSFSDQAILGQSSNLTVRPFGFDVSVVDNLEAQNSAGSIFLSAGENFTVDISAVGWTNGTDVNQTRQFGFSTSCCLFVCLLLPRLL